MALELFFLRFLGPSTSSRAHSCGSRYRLSPSLNLFASTYHEFEDNLAAFYLRYVHNLRVCSYLARSSCGILTRLLYVVCTYLYIRFFCPAGISEGFLCFYSPCEYPCLCLHPRFSCGTYGAKCSRLLCKYLSRISGRNF